MSDKRAEVNIADGIKYVHEHKNEFDVIMVDSPLGFDTLEILIHITVDWGHTFV